MLDTDLLTTQMLGIYLQMAGKCALSRGYSAIYEAALQHKVYCREPISKFSEAELAQCGCGCVADTRL